MNLTQGQLATLRAWLDANAAGVQDEEAAALLNAPAAPDYYVWRRDVPAVDIFDKVVFANYTPNDSPTETLIYNNRALLAQTKQLNMQLLLQNRVTFDASKTNLRTALNDATTNLPTGANGVNRSGGWSAILPILSRKATVGEKLYAVDDGAGTGNTTSDPRGAQTNPDNFGTGSDGMPLEGRITAQNVSEARNLP
jgi:hypothetical protein